MRLQLLKKNLPAFIALTLSCSGIIPASASSIAGANDVKVVNKFAAADSVVECATIKDALDQTDGTIVRLTLNNAYVLFEKEQPGDDFNNLTYLIHDNTGVITLYNIDLNGALYKELTGTLVAQVSYDKNIHKLVATDGTDESVNRLTISEGESPKPEIKSVGKLTSADIASLVTVNGTVTQSGTGRLNTKYFLKEGTDSLQIVDKMGVGLIWKTLVGAEISFTGVVLEGTAGPLQLMPIQQPSVQYSYSDSEEKAIQTTSEKVNVTIKRSFKGGVWNTFCAPFDLTMGQIVDAFGLNTKVRTLSKKHDGTVIYFDEASSIEAGHPYIIMPEEAVEEPVFKDVKVTSTTPETVSTADGEYSFTGIYAPTALADDGTQLFLSNNNFAKPAKNSKPLKGFRGYFTVPASTDANVLKVSVDGQTTSVSKLVAGEVEANAPIYNLNGQLVGNDAARLAKGLYIKNGKKFIVK